MDEEIIEGADVAEDATEETKVEEKVTPKPGPSGKEKDLLAAVAGERAKNKALQEQIASIAVALGVNTAEENPKEVAARAMAELRDLKMSIAVRAAIPSGIDPDLLLDSVAFNRGLSHLEESEVSDYVDAFIADRKIGKSRDAVTVAKSKPVSAPRPTAPKVADDAPTDELAAIWAE